MQRLNEYQGVDLAECSTVSVLFEGLLMMRRKDELGKSK